MFGNQECVIIWKWNAEDIYWENDWLTKGPQIIIYAEQLNYVILLVFITAV